MSINKASLKRSVRAFYLSQLCENATFGLGVNLLYMHLHLGLSFTQALLLYVVSFSASIVFDLLGGSLADIHGRKMIYRAGIVLYVAAFGIPIIFVHSFALLLPLAILGGIGIALKSNALHATLADILADDQDWFRRANGNGLAWLFISRASAAAIGGFLYHIYPPLPFIAEAVVILLAVVTVNGMHEPRPTSSNEQPEPLAAAWQHAWQTIRYMRRQASHVIRITMFTALTFFFAGDLLFSYYQPFFARHGYSAAMLGVLFAAISLLSAGGSWLVVQLHHQGWRFSVLGIGAITFILNGLGVAAGIPAPVLATCLLQAVANGVSMPTLHLITSEATVPRLRASALSVTTSMVNIGSLGGLLCSGILADHGSSRQVGLLAAGMVVAAFGWIGLRGLGQPTSTVAAITADSAH